jgi:bacillithiol biosynthesis deacetylase BshB1
MAEKLDVLVLAAHRDDIEITCGGTVIKLVDLGYKVGIVDFTQGEMGTKGTEVDRAREAEAAAKAMGIAVRENLKMPDSGLEFTRENKLKVAEQIRKYKPHLLILPYWEQRHPDHAMCPKISWDAAFYAGLKKMPLPGEPHRPFKIIYSTSFFDLRHSFIVDITDQFKRKTEAVACYRSQFDETPESKEIFPPARNIFEFMEVQARALGYKIGKRYGEAFYTKEITEVADPMKLTVKSI